MNTETTLPTEIKINAPEAAALAKGPQSALAMVEAFEVVDDATYELGSEELAGIKAKLNTLDEQRKALTRPLDQVKAGIMDLYRGPVDLLTRAEAALKRKLIAYADEQRRKAEEERLQRERAAQEERDRLQKEAADLAAQGRAGEAAVKETVAAMVVAAPPAVAEAPKVAGQSISKTVDFEVVDLSKLLAFIVTGNADTPLARPELLSLVVGDSVKLRAHVKSMGMACKTPGLRVFEKSNMSVRGAK